MLGEEADDVVLQAVDGADGDGLRAAFTVLGRISATHTAARPWLEALLAVDDDALPVRAEAAFDAALGMVRGDGSSDTLIGLALAERLDRAWSEATSPGPPAAAGDRLDDLAAVIGRRVPSKTLSLRALAMTAARRLVVLAAPDSLARAERLLGLASQRGASGDASGAVAALNDALAVLQRLAPDGDQGLQGITAICLEDLGNWLAILGDREGAIAALQDSLARFSAIYEAFIGAAISDQTSEPALRLSIARRSANVATIQVQLGRHDDAISYLRRGIAMHDWRRPQGDERLVVDREREQRVQALSGPARAEQPVSATELRAIVEDYRQLAAERPDAYLLDLAFSLARLGTVRAAGAGWDDALSAAEEAIAVFRKLARRRPGEFDDPLSQCLVNASQYHEQRGSLSAAVAAAQEAVGVARNIAASRPHAQPALAFALERLACALGRQGHLDAAITTFREALERWRELFALYPDRHCLNLENCLVRLGRGLAEQGDVTAAAQVILDGLEHFPFADALPWSFLFLSRGRLLGELARWLAASGDQATALATANEACVFLRRRSLVGDDGPPALAVCLDQIVALRLHAGDSEGAVTALGEGAATLCALAGERSDDLVSALARQMIEHARWLGRSGDTRRAAEAAHEAVEVFRVLLPSRPEVRAPLTDALSVLAQALADTGDLERARQVIMEQVELFRSMPESDDDGCLGLAAALVSLSNLRRGCGDREGALGAVRESLALCERLAISNPEAFLARLAMAHADLGAALAAAGDHAGAVAATRAAVETFGRVPESRRAESLLGLAAALDQLGACLAAMPGELERALTARREATAVYRDLARSRPGEFALTLSRCLADEARLLGRLGELRVAVASANEAGAIALRLAAEHEDSLPWVATALGCLATIRGEVGDVAGATTTAQECVALYRGLAHSHPKQYARGLAGALNDLGWWLRERGDVPGATEAVAEAAERLRDLVAANPGHAGDLVIALVMLSNVLGEAGDGAGAVDSAREAVERAREAEATDPSTGKLLRAHGLQVLGRWLGEAGCTDEAVEATGDAVAELRALLLGPHPPMAMPLLAESLAEHARWLFQAGRRDPALAVHSEAAQLVRELSGPGAMVYWRAARRGLARLERWLAAEEA